MIDQGELQAILDGARNVQCLSTTTSSDTLKEAVRILSKRIGLKGLIERISFSAYADELLVSLLEGGSATQLGRAVQSIHEYSYGFNDVPLRDFADRYWSGIVRGWINTQEARRAWEELQKAYRGFRVDDDMWDDSELRRGQPPVHGSAFRLAASKEALRRLVGEIYAQMRSASRVPAIGHPLVALPASPIDFPITPEIAGWPFTVALGGVEASCVNEVGQMSLLISWRLCQDRRDREAARADKKRAAEG